MWFEKSVFYQIYPSLRLDLEQLTFSDSSGIAVLLRAYRRMRQLEGSMEGDAHAPVPHGDFQHLSGQDDFYI